MESPGGSLADLLVASSWLVELRGADPALVAAAVATFLATESVPVERMTKKGLRTFDCRAAVIALDVTDTEGEPALALVLRHTVPAVRPDDVLSGLAAVSGFTPPTTALLTRLAQGPLDEANGSVGDPLA